MQKFLYRLKQPQSVRFEKFIQFVKVKGALKVKAHTMFFKHSQDEKISILIVYVDNIILTADDKLEMNQLKTSFSSTFEIKDLGPLRYFLGIEVARSKKGIVVSK